MKLQALHEVIASCESVLVAYSGGVDSALLAHVAREVLGDRALAVTVASALQPEREIREAADCAARIGIRHEILAADPLADDRVRRNSPERCYWCKRIVFGAAIACARARGIGVVIDGAHADDRGDARPGERAARELGVRSPLRDVGLTKPEIRDAARRRGIAVWDKPSNACLATRIPFNTPVTAAALERVAAAEALLAELGFPLVRVRHYETTARLEIPRADMPRLLDEAVRTSVISGLKKLGYVYVTLDLAGYRSGSMHEAVADASGQARAQGR